MSTRKGGSRRGRTTNWTIKPVHDHDIQTNQTHETTSTATIPENFSNSKLNDHGRPQNRRNPRGKTRVFNARGKARFLKKPDKEEKDSDGGSGLKLNIDSDCGGINGIEDVSASGSRSELNIGSDSGENKSEKVEKVEQLNSSDNEVGEDEIANRLEELRVGADEPELSEELLIINKQLQEDELLAMESIYGDNIFILDNQSGLKCFQVHIHVEAPKGFRITAKLNSSRLNDKNDEDSSDFSYSFQVEYLPPIILTCLLPKTYPSISPPHFTISVQWLGPSLISDLCHNLDSIWQEQVGQEVIYQWVEWLHGSSLSHVRFDDEIVLGPYGLSHDIDRRAISGCLSPDVDIPNLKSYNDEQRHDNFCRNIQECCICYSEFVGSEFIRLPCQHFFCQKCMKTFSDMHIAEGKVLKLKCPESKCEGMIPPGLLRRLLGDEEFERWESLTLQKTLESMTDVVYCPRCETACLEDEENHAQCSKCYYSFCTLCREKRHVGVSCMTAEMRLIILKGRQSSTSMNNEQRRREQDMINQLLSIKEISTFAKQCPSCKMAISRTEGCNKMVCDNCGQYFCYRCNKAISGYNHFRDGQCELFPTEEIQRWEERMNGRALAGQIQAEMFADNSHPCPLCGQLNLKVGNNNHIFCWACQNHYCYICRKMVRKSSNHYGPKGCKQHTVG